MANSTTLYTLPDGRIAVDVTENKTLGATDCGIVQNVITDAITVTLPATVVGYAYTIRNGGDNASGTPTRSASDGSMVVNVSPNASDKIAGLGVSAVDDKDYINTKATSHVGDEVSLVGDGVNGWMTTSMKGTWAQQP
jgi:hypothetical protein